MGSDVTGFDTSLPGELGVLAASVEQGFAPGGKVQEWSARIYYPIRGFGGWKALKAARLRGRRIAASAECLLTFKYEDALERTVVDVRQALGL